MKNYSCAALLSFHGNMANTGRKVLLLILAGGLIVFSSCTKEALSGITPPVTPPTPAPSPCSIIVEVGTSIHAATTWQACHIYHCANFVSVNAVLTIEAGAIIKFDALKGLNV